MSVGMIPEKVLRDLFALQLMSTVYRGSIELGQIDQQAIAQECYELADTLLKVRGAPDQRDQEIAALKRQLAAFKANSTRRKARK